MKVTLNGLLIALCISCAILSLAGCTTQTPSRGNAPTYSGNGSGNYTEQALEECANAAVVEFRKDPTVDADALFQFCVHELGIRSI